MTLAEEVSEIFKKFNERSYRTTRKDSVKFSTYNPEHTFMANLDRKNKKKVS